jgi:acetyl esterase/lipase
MCGDFYQKILKSDDKLTETEQVANNFQPFIDECRAENLETQRHDPYLYPICMGQKIAQKMPPTAILTTEFDHYLRDAKDLGRLLHRVNRLVDFTILPGVHHGFETAMYGHKLTDNMFKDFGTLISKLMPARNPQLPS